MDNSSHYAINLFLLKLRQYSPVSSSLNLSIQYWQPEDTGIRGIIQSRSTQSPGIYEQQVLDANQNENETNGETHADGSLTIGQRFDIRCTMPRDGYLHLFNLGSDGSCHRLYPDSNGANTFLRQGKTFLLPDTGETPQGGFEVSGPTTEETSALDYLLIILTHGKLSLNVHDLDPNLVARHRWKDSRAFIFDENEFIREPDFLNALKGENWEYTILSYKIRR